MVSTPSSSVCRQRRSDFPRTSATSTSSSSARFSNTCYPPTSSVVAGAVASSRTRRRVVPESDSLPILSGRVSFDQRFASTQLSAFLLGWALRTLTVQAEARRSDLERLAARGVRGGSVPEILQLLGLTERHLMEPARGRDRIDLLVRQGRKDSLLVSEEDLSPVREDNEAFRPGSSSCPPSRSRLGKMLDCRRAAAESALLWRSGGFASAKKSLPCSPFRRRDPRLRHLRIRRDRRAPSNRIGRHDLVENSRV